MFRLLHRQVLFALVNTRERKVFRIFLSVRSTDRTRKVCRYFARLRKRKSLINWTIFICGGGETASTLFETYSFSTPFPFVSTLTRKRSSNLTRKCRRALSRLRPTKKTLMGHFVRAGTLVLGPFTDKSCNVISNNFILP